MKHFSKKQNKNQIAMKNPKTRIKKKKINVVPKKYKNFKMQASDEDNYDNEFEESDTQIAQNNLHHHDEEEEETETVNDEDSTPLMHKLSLKDLKKVDTDFLEAESSEVASDDSDFETENTIPDKSGKITVLLVNEWEKQLKMTKKTTKFVSNVVKAFHACLLRITEDSDVKSTSDYKVDGSSVFNAVIRLCVTSLYPYLQTVMNLPSNSVTKKHVENTKKWPSVKNIIRVYITDLVKLIGNVTSEDILRILLKHLHQMIPFAVCLPTISKIIIKQLILLWSTNNDNTVRVIAFLCILHFATSDLSLYLHNILKKMYVSYVTNCKFISQNTISSVNFMRKSLAEMFSLNEMVTYNHAFLYIRQLAIHLRSAIILKKKDNIQAVYNWQFISSLKLWVDVLCNMKDKQQLNSLIYPTVQIIIGVIKLIPTTQYFPLRFHCIQMLIKLSKETEVFIPILAFLIEALSVLNVNAQHKKLSMKPLDFTYILRLSKSQLQENSFKDTVIEYIYEYILECAAAESHRISFPDTVVFLQIQLKQFLKECKKTNYNRKLKPLLEKIEDVSKFMCNERKKCGVSLSDERSILAWESNMKLKSNSLITLYESLQKVNQQKKERKIVDKIEFSEYDLPEIKKPASKINEKEKSADNNYLELFEFDAAGDELDSTKKTKKLDDSIIKSKSSKTSSKLKTKKRKYKEVDKCGEKFNLKVQKLQANEDCELNENKDIVEDLKLSEFLS